MILVLAVLSKEWLGACTCSLQVRFSKYFPPIIWKLTRNTWPFRKCLFKTIKPGALVRFPGIPKLACVFTVLTNLQPPCSQTAPTGTAFALAPRGLKKERTTLSKNFIAGGESGWGGRRLRAAAEETFADTVHGTKVQHVLRTHIPVVLCGSVLHRVLFIQRVLEAKRKGFQVSQPRHPVSLSSSFLWKIRKPPSHCGAVLPAPGPLLWVLEGGERREDRSQQRWIS